METTGSSNVRPSQQKEQSPEQQLRELFGSYRAEWLKERLFDLFTEPSYFPELTGAQHCMLIGGRGTGKTTALRMLSYDGQYAVRNEDALEAWPYYGVYYRVNTNRVTAFKGPEVGQGQWVRLFSHYINLVFCDLITQFLQWYQLHGTAPLDLSAQQIRRVAQSLHLGEEDTIAALCPAVQKSLLRFEAQINNVADGIRVPLSMLGAPIDELLAPVMASPVVRNKHFFLLVDEYENLENYQQQVLNTLLKQAGALYSFKIGVRELGWRIHTTLNENERLISPADYIRIDITEKLGAHRFRGFASAVCSQRLERLSVLEGRAPAEMSSVLAHVTEDEEARLLDVREHQDSIITELSLDLTEKESQYLGELAPLQVYFLRFWANGQKMTLAEAFGDMCRNRQAWDERYANYKHSLLFTLRRGKRGIIKYYAGWNVFCQLAAGNIRYLLELVDRSLAAHLQAGSSLGEAVSVKVQTETAQRVGRKNLSELEGLTVQGAELTKLLLGLGRVFEVMAADTVGHAPEVNHFEVIGRDGVAGVDSDSELEEVDALLNASVMHLALLRKSGSKLGDMGETRDYDYMVHPIFSPFFVFSYRWKRKMRLSASDILGLVRTPKQTIRRVLRSQKRKRDEPLPQQMMLFEAYYDDSS